MDSAKAVEVALWKKANKEKAEFFPRFFKTGPGEYGEGDQFIGVVVPEQRKIAKRFKNIALKEIKSLLESPLHECRLTGLLILVLQFQQAKDEPTRKEIFDFYMDHLDRVNNWDLVDSSAHKIVGPYLQDRSRKPLYRLAKAKNHLWKNRVAIIATLHFIKQGDLEDCISLSQILLNHPHDLIHKAVGWMLRESGKQNEGVLMAFIENHGDDMPRTMLRYAIEKLPSDTRKEILQSYG